MKKNLLLFTDGFPYGEKERSFISTEFEYLMQNFNVTIVALTSNTQMTHSFPAGVSVYNLAWSNADLLINAPLLLKKRLRIEITKAACNGQTEWVTKRRIIRHELIALYYERWLRDYLKSNKVDLIYTYWCTSATLAAVRIKSIYSDLSLKVVSRFHGYDLYNDRTEGANWQPFRDEISDGLDKLVFISETGKNYYLDNWYVDVNKCIVSYLGTKEYAMIGVAEDADNTYTVVSCSECKALKRVNLIIESLALVSEIKIKWVHLGEGTEFEILKQLANDRLKEKYNVDYEFVGWLEHSRLHDFYRDNKVQLFITLSETEGLPISVSEAIAMGIPAIATDVGGMKELVNDRNGYLVDKDIAASDVASIIERHFSKTLQERVKMSDCARELWKEKFDADENAKTFIKILCDL